MSDKTEQISMDKIVPINIAEEMKKSYIDYAMSVIVARALPDVRDGLKPVHRRILYSMNELNLEPNKAYKKSARITGDVMGKYHPHGNAAIYDAMVRMAQDFSMRYMLVDGHGNFGSMDGDEPAAERYTEARLSKIAMQMLTDIEKDTVDFVPNYTEELKEPSVMPARYPNLLANGVQGIAVGMATNIPPHNLSEIIDAVVKIIDDLAIGIETDIESILEIIKGPDFPTKATILGISGIKQAYKTGKGKITIRSTCEIVPMKNNREMIVVTELPYQVNKAKLIEKIADLVRDKKIDGISDIRDESDRKGLRIAIELKKDANANVVLNLLYKFTSLQETFSIAMLALYKNEPKILNLMQILGYYLEHQEDVITKRTNFDLSKALARLHIVEGFLKALDYIDEIISIIRANREISKSKEMIIDKFDFSQIQADAIVEMRLRALSGLEKEKLKNEEGNLNQNISYLKSLLADKNLLRSVIKSEILDIKKKFADERRTKIIAEESEIDIEDLIPQSECVITITRMGYIKRIPLDTYNVQKRGGKGVSGLKTREEDIIKNFFIANTHDDIIFITSGCKAYKLKSYQIPEASRQAKGTAIVNLLKLDSASQIAGVVVVSDYSKGYLTTISKFGIIKRTPMASYKNINKGGVKALGLKENDSLVSVLHTTGNDEIFIATANGMGVRFKEELTRESASRGATGIIATRPRTNDYVVGAEILSESKKILFVTENGYGKCTEYKEFRMQKHGGIGTKTYNITPKTGNIISIASMAEKEEILLINSNGIIIRIKTDTIRTCGRVASGVKLIELSNNAKVIGIAKIQDEEDASGIDSV